MVLPLPFPILRRFIISKPALSTFERLNFYGQRKGELLLSALVRVMQPTHIPTKR